MNKADNLPMSADEWHDKNEKMYLSIYHFSQEYANYLLSHHINVLAERIADEYEFYHMTDDGIETARLKKGKVLKIAKDYINELNLNK